MLIQKLVGLGFHRIHFGKGCLGSESARARTSVIRGSDVHSIAKCLASTHPRTDKLADK